MGASTCAPLAVFLLLACTPGLPAIQRPPSSETPAQRAQAQERLYEGKFQDQPSDEAAKKMAERTAAQVTKAFAQLMQNVPGTRVRKLECRNTMCRLETEHASDEARQKFVQAAFFDARTAWRGPFAVVRIEHAKQGDWPVSAVIYLGEERQDSRPPDAPARAAAPTPAAAPTSAEPTPPTKQEKP